jgi:hypothetical protein
MAHQGAKIVVNDIGTSTDGIGFSMEPANKVVKEVIESGGATVASYDTVATEEGAAAVIDAAIKDLMI